MGLIRLVHESSQGLETQDSIQVSLGCQVSIPAFSYHCYPTTGIKRYIVAEPKGRAQPS